MTIFFFGLISDGPCNFLLSSIPLYPALRDGVNVHFTQTEEIQKVHSHVLPRRYIGWVNAEGICRLRWAAIQ